MSFLQSLGGPDGIALKGEPQDDNVFELANNVRTTKTSVIGSFGGEKRLTNFR